MNQIVRERDRLLQRTTRVFGLGFTALAAFCVVIPGALPPIALAVVLPLLLLLGFSQYRIGVTGRHPWSAIILLTGFALLVLLTRFPGVDEPAVAAVTGALHIAAGSMASVAISMRPTPGRLALLAAAFLATLGLLLTTELGRSSLFGTVVFIVVGWSSALLLGLWLTHNTRRAARRITSIGRAHRAERQASETEAQRRQGARLLHDTVLATLTLLAHSGVGVSEKALQEQAANDARLLRQLRLGGTPVPQASGGYALEAVEESVLGNTLESVKQRFGRIGLEVDWHGTGQVLLPSDILDAFLLSLAECLENVRRHSGVTVAHVTITDDDTTVRAMVTDSGVGFAIGDIDQARLGFKESVVARLRDVGGNARLFSAPGSGTTVVLEVPK
ncbi:sensor histidine kinase [Planctomonas psychrotolerans]|uniref:sensor histidine kinase n=1 Tax=Planctomonas psychrotolerans TaxID=2528712 RepID=UPI00123A2215|nr:ATP-binding protein [Planctomonas psychrotolerans]